MICDWWISICFVCFCVSRFVAFAYFHDLALKFFHLLTETWQIQIPKAKLFL